MKATNIKWDVTDDGENTTQTQEEMNKILETLPTEVEIPNHLIDGDEDIDSDCYYSDISDWLSDKFGFCHYGFTLEN